MSSPFGAEKLRIEGCSMIEGVRIEDKEKQKIRVFFVLNR